MEEFFDWNEKNYGMEWPTALPRLFHFINFITFINSIPQTAFGEERVN